MSLAGLFLNRAGTFDCSLLVDGTSGWSLANGIPDMRVKQPRIQKEPDKYLRASYAVPARSEPFKARLDSTRLKRRCCSGGWQMSSWKVQVSERCRLEPEQLRQIACDLFRRSLWTSLGGRLTFPIMGNPVLWVSESSYIHQSPIFITIFVGVL